jgi:ABC-type bacteriocin/lantibiotic exporter with double-glycine peptidase domain
MRRRAIKARRYLPLRMRPFRQTAGLCGPASLKIACSFFGREYGEAYLAKLSGGTPELGTDHDGLIAAAKALGATVEAGAHGSLRLLQRLVSVRRLPVIVGWFSPSTPRKTRFDPEKDEVEDHFSVVYHVTDTHVYLMDPETASGRKKMTVGRFLKLWWDTDGPDDERVERWYMAIDFSGKKP